MRQTEFRRVMRRTSDELAASVQMAAQAELNWLFRQVQYKIRRINQFRPRVNSPRPKLAKAYVFPGDLWETFRMRMQKSLMRELLSGAIALAALYREFYSLGEAVEIDSDELARAIEPEIGERITRVSNTVKREVGRQIVGWYNTPDMTMNTLVGQMQDRFGRSRAALIAQHEVTSLNSKVTERIAGAVGVGEWWWSTRRDQIVCKKPLTGPDGKTYQGCRELHGKVFKVGMPMPPQGSHIGCRCDAILIVPVAPTRASTTETTTSNIAGAVAALKLQKDFNPDEARDDSGRWTAGAGGSSSSQQEQGKVKVGGKIYTSRGKTASDISGHVPERGGKPVPLTSKHVYHVTQRKNIDSILEHGFDLGRVDPRWVNDYAVSTTNAPLPKAMEYFMPYVRGAQFDNEKYAVLEIQVKGRFYDENDGVNYSGGSPQQWTRNAVSDGWDGQMGHSMYIYNPKAITQIKEVDPADIAAANEKLKTRHLKAEASVGLQKADWEESKHPRDKKGEFAPKGQGEAHGAAKKPKLQPQLNRGTGQQVLERQRARAAAMSARYPGVRFSLATYNPLAVKGHEDYPGIGLPHAIFDPKAPAVDDKDKINAVIDAQQKWGGGSGYVTYTTVQQATGLSYQDIFGVLNGLRAKDQKSVLFTVDRMNNNHAFKYHETKPEEGIAYAPNPAIDDLPEVIQFRANHYVEATAKIVRFATKAGIPEEEFSVPVMFYMDATVGHPEKSVEAYKSFLKSAHSIMAGKLDTNQQADLVRLENSIRVADWRFIKNLDLPKKPVKVKSAGNKPDVEKPVGVKPKKEVLTGAVVANKIQALLADKSYSKETEALNAEADKYKQILAANYTDKNMRVWYAADAKARAARHAEKAKKQTQIISMLRAEKPSTIEAYGLSNLDRKIEAKARDGFDEVGKVMDASVKLRHNVGIESDNKRAHYSPNRNTIVVDTRYGVVDATIHEFGHHIENNNFGVRRAVIDFYKKRTKGQRVQRLNEVLPHRHYDNSEYCVKDKFIDPYVGKIYPDNSTEVLSMGLVEYIRRPEEFVQKDPEHFALIYDVLHGRFNK